MISYPSINLGNTVDSNQNISNYLISAFAEDGEDKEDDEDKIKTSDKSSSENNDNEDDSTNDNEDDSTNDNEDDSTNDNEDDSTNDNEDDSTNDNEDDSTNDNEDDSTNNHEDETEIEVEVKNDKTKVKIDLNGNKYKFIIDDVSESAIITAIIDKTGLTEDQIRANWDYHIESDSDKGDSQTHEQILKHENKAKETADDTIQQLQQKIDQLEQRLQDLLNQFETGKYFGPITTPDATPDSYTASFTGTATSLDDESIVSSVDGDIYLESITTGSHTFKLRVTGGDILIGDAFYDFVFGKARLASSDGTTSVIVLGQIMDDQGDVSTIRLTMNTITPITNDLSEPISFTVDSSRSKIAKQWSLDATGDFGLV